MSISDADTKDFQDEAFASKALLNEYMDSEYIYGYSNS